MKTLVLASSSPRRREIMQSLRLPFLFDSATDFIEHPKETFRFEILALENAKGKVLDVATRHQNALILGVDTIGYLDGKILEKPKDLQDAKEMLESMQGKTHHIASGIYILDTSTGRHLEALDETQVRMAPMTHDEIEIYLKKEEVLDKSGSYAAQGLMSLFIESFQGDFWNVVGLPLAKINSMLKSFDIELLNAVE